MEDHVFNSTFKIENENWWYRSRRHLFKALIEKYSKGAVTRSLDLGCGVGSNSKLLQGEICGLDANPLALSFCRDKGYDRLKQGRIESIPFPDGHFELVLCSEVLEHVKDDRAAVREISRIMRSGGICLVTVPAFSFLWHDNDIVGKHFRRYDKKTLAALLESEGLKIERINYWNFVFFLPVLVVVYLSRMLGRRRKEEISLNMGPAFMDRLVFLSFLENKLFLKIGWPFGTSVIAIVRKI